MAKSAPEDAAVLEVPPEYPSVEELQRFDDDRELEMARERGVDEATLGTLLEKTRWLVSNRVDDRVVIWEVDIRHPGGEVMLGGSSPRRAYLTPDIEQLIYSGWLVDVPPPLRYVQDGDGTVLPNRKYPQQHGPDLSILRVAMPGQPTPLGRKLDPELWSQEMRDEVARRTRGLPKEAPVPKETIIGGGGGAR
jgi:hypothetical protein